MAAFFVVVCVLLRCVAAHDVALHLFCLALVSCFFFSLLAAFFRLRGVRPSTDPRVSFQFFVNGAMFTVTVSLLFMVVGCCF